MKLSAEKKKDILTKNDTLDKIKPILKTEFLGIDDVIDTIIDSIRPFYIFPESLKRPLVINLWGLTATGKTCLVERIFQLLEMNNNYMRFDVGEYTNSDYKLRMDLSDAAERLSGTYPVFVFDEFQFGRTIDEKGCELESNAMRPVWDLIDSGKITTFAKITSFRHILRVIEQCMESGQVEINKGIVVRGEGFFETLTHVREKQISDYHTINFDKLKLSKQNQKNERYTIYDEKNMGYLTEPYFITYEWFHHYFFSANPKFFKHNAQYKEMREKYFSQNSLEELYDFVKKNFVDVFNIMDVNDFSKSLIFCIGNIDEAYNMHGSSNPDADADAYHENSLKITLPKMKEALLARFRMEQIGRLGNNHIIYPAFNKDAYSKIIDKHINMRKQYFSDEFGIDIEFDSSINDLIYKEGVFPSQGVRPLLSTLNTVLDSFISKIIADLVLQCPKVNKINWTFSFETEKHIIKTIDLPINISFEYDVKLCVEKLRKSDFSESQAFTAVHEAGHAVIATMMAGLIPDEVVSRTASTAEGFCRVSWPDIVTKDLYYKQIMMCLGGLEAEKLIFGPEMISNGGNSDLIKATSIASSMIKSFGMGKNRYVAETHKMPNNEYTAIHDDGESEHDIINIMRQAEFDVRKCLQKNELFLLVVSEYLSNNSKIDTEKFNELAKPYIKNVTLIENLEKAYNFRDIITQRKDKKMIAKVKYEKTKSRKSSKKSNECRSTEAIAKKVKL